MGRADVMVGIPAVLQGSTVRAVLLAVTVLAVPGLAAFQTLDSTGTAGTEVRELAKGSEASAPAEIAGRGQTANPAALGLADGVLLVPVAPAELVFHDRVDPAELRWGGKQSSAVAGIVLDRCSGLLLGPDLNTKDVGVLVPANGYKITSEIDDAALPIKVSVVTAKTASVELAGVPATFEVPIDLRAGASGWLIPQAIEPTQSATDDVATQCGELVTPAALEAGGAGAVALPYTVERRPSVDSYKWLLLSTLVAALLGAVLGTGIGILRLRKFNEGSDQWYVTTAKQLSMTDIDKEVTGTRMIAAVAGGTTSLITITVVLTDMTPGFQIAGLLVVGALAAGLVGVGGALQASVSELAGDRETRSPRPKLVTFYVVGGSFLAVLGLAMAAMTNPFLLLHSELDSPGLRTILTVGSLIIVAILVMLSQISTFPPRPADPQSPGDRQ